MWQQIIPLSAELTLANIMTSQQNIAHLQTLLLARTVTVQKTVAKQNVFHLNICNP